MKIRKKEILEDIKKAHPIMNIGSFKRLLLLLKQRRKLTRTKIARMLRIKRSIVVSRANILEKHGYIVQQGRNKKGKPLIFLVVEGQKPIFDYAEQEEAIKQHTTALAERIKKDKRIAKIVRKEKLNLFLRMVAREDFRDSLALYWDIVEQLELNEIKEYTKEVKIGTLALRAVLTVKGELEASKIEEEQEAEEKSENESKAKSDESKKGEAAA